MPKTPTRSSTNKRSTSNKKQPVSNDDSDDDEDHDYNPDDKDAEDEVMEDIAASAVSTSLHLTSLQQQTVDQAFERLFGYPWGKKYELPSQLTTRDQILLRVLGRKMTASILKGTMVSKAAVVKATFFKTYQKPAAAATRSMRPSTGSGSVPASPANKKESPRRGEPKGGGVDQLLEDLKGPAKITTVGQSSAAWDSFKDDTGLGQKLEEHAQSKEAYLNRQDFLTRTDHRTFEVERRQRDRDRAKRGT